MSLRTPDRCSRQPRDHVFTGLVLITVGVAALLEQQGYGVLQALWTHWPLVFGVFGLLRLLSARRARHVSSGLFMLLLSAWFYGCETEYRGMSYHNSWPMLLLALGLGKIVLGWWGMRQAGRQGEQA